MINEFKTCAHDYVLPIVKSVLSQLKIAHNAKILDADCGGGYLVHELYKMNYHNIWGFDISKSGINVSQHSFPDIKEKFKVHNAYARELPHSFPLANYDLILSVEVIEHLYHPKAYVENINYWLKSRGYLIITTPYHGYLKNLVITALNKFDDHFNPISNGGHIKFFSRKTIYNVIENETPCSKLRGIITQTESLRCHCERRTKSRSNLLRHWQSV
jgi:2-polyprenyl-3-methyl-5-hydroxy-6-metoxy-1,4-benzoquinol methylase